MSWYISVLKNYAVFSGRARRKEFWMFTLFQFLAVLALIIVEVILGAATGGFQPWQFFLLVAPYFLGTFIPSLAVTVRRLHDTGRSGAWYFISFVPYIGGIILLVLNCLDSQPGPNQYGPNPKQPQFTPDGYGFVGSHQAGYPQGYPGYPQPGNPQAPVEGYGPDAVEDFNGR
jgi:uncharacterized membrane protein YhaH (DUF805 family)